MYAIRKDGKGWRAINSPNDVLPDEDFSEDQPALVVDQAPQVIDALQGLLALDHAGLSSAYEAWANDPSRTFAQRAFINKAVTWRRDDPTLNAAAIDLGLSGEQVDQLFLLAVTL